MEPDRQTRSETQRRPRGSFAAGANHQVLLWSAAVVAVVLLGVAAFAIFRVKAPVTTVALVDPPPAPPALVGVAGIKNPTEEDAIATHLDAARTAIANQGYACALQDHLTPVLSIDAGNEEAIDLKRQPEAALKKPPRSPAGGDLRRNGGRAETGANRWPGYTASHEWR